jgi:hypothetical protein
MRKGQIGMTLVVPLFGFAVLVGCESGETVRQDTKVRTRDDGTVIRQEEKVVRQSDGTTVKTESRKVDRPDDND